MAYWMAKFYSVYGVSGILYYLLGFFLFIISTDCTDLFEERVFHYTLLSRFFFFLNEELSPPSWKKRNKKK